MAIFIHNFLVLSIKDDPFEYVVDYLYRQRDSKVKFIYNFQISQGNPLGIPLVILNIIHMESAFCKFQSYQLDLLMRYVIVKRHNGDKSLDEVEHEMNVTHGSLNVVDRDLLLVNPNYPMMLPMEILKLKNGEGEKNSIKIELSLNFHIANKLNFHIQFFYVYE